MVPPNTLGGSESVPQPWCNCPHANGVWGTMNNGVTDDEKEKILHTKTSLTNEIEHTVPSIRKSPSANSFKRNAQQRFRYGKLSAEITSEDEA